MRKREHIYLVVCEHGLMNVFTDDLEAIAAAEHIHTLVDLDFPETNFCPVWVVQQYLGPGGESFPLGMFPDRRNTEAPGTWVSAVVGDGPEHNEEFPWPKFNWQGTEVL